MNLITTKPRNLLVFLPFWLPWSLSCSRQQSWASSIPSYATLISLYISNNFNFRIFTIGKELLFALLCQIPNLQRKHWQRRSHVVRQFLHSRKNASIYERNSELFFGDEYVTDTVLLSREIRRLQKKKTAVTFFPDHHLKIYILPPRLSTYRRASKRNTF